MKLTRRASDRRRDAASPDRSVIQIWNHASSSSGRKTVSSRTSARLLADAPTSSASATNGSGSASITTASVTVRSRCASLSRVSTCRTSATGGGLNQARSIQPSARNTNRAGGMNRQNNRRRSAPAR